MHLAAKITAPLVCLAMIAAPPVVRADAAQARTEPATTPSETDVAEAKRLRAEAETHFFNQEFDDAIAKFQQAHDLAPHASDLFNMGRIHEEKGDLVSALRLYEEFVEQPRLSLADRSAAGERIQVLRVVVKKPEESPAPPPARVSDQDELDNPKTRRSSSERDAAPTTAGRPLIISGSTLLGIGAAVAASGGVGFGLAARRNSDKIQTLSEGSNPERLSLSEAEALHARGKDFQTLQITFLVGGSVMALVGAGLLAGGLVRRNKARLQAVAPVVGSRMVALNATWRF